MTVECEGSPVEVGDADTLRHRWREKRGHRAKARIEQPPCQRVSRAKTFRLKCDEENTAESSTKSNTEAGKHTEPKRTSKGPFSLEIST
jgi:hypothetical protein